MDGVRCAGRITQIPHKREKVQGKSIGKLCRTPFSEKGVLQRLSCLVCCTKSRFLQAVEGPLAVPSLPSCSTNHSISFQSACCAGERQKANSQLHTVRLAAKSLQMDSYLPHSSHPVLCSSVPGRPQRLRGIQEDLPLPPILVAFQVGRTFMGCQSKQDFSCQPFRHHS